MGLLGVKKYQIFIISLQACPFVMELYTKKGKNTLSLVSVSDGGEPLQRALSEAVLKTSTAKSIKNKRDLILLIGEFDQRVTIAVQNQVWVKSSLHLNYFIIKNCFDSLTMLFFNVLQEY